MLDDTYFMKQALVEAQKAADRGEVPVGAVVVCKERIIGRAHNLTETLNDVTAHAEMQAITAAANVLGGKYLNECTLYVTGTLRNVCRGYSLGTNWKISIWSGRREAWISTVCRSGIAPQNDRCQRGACGRVCCIDESLFCSEKMNNY